MTGATLSSTTIVRLHVAELPHASVAVHVLTKLYSCGHVPGMESVANVITGIPPHASVAVADPNVGVAGH